MKKCVFLIIFALGLLSAKDIKIGFVDSERIFEQYQATAAATEEFNDFVRTYRDSASVLRQNIQTIKNELESEKLVLSDEARLRKLDEIERLQQEYEAFLESIFGKNGKVDQKNDELMAPLTKKINEAVKKTAEQEGFTMVLDMSEGIFFASNELDLTDMVVDELNLEYGPQIIPGAEVKKVIAIFPFRAENTEAETRELGEWMQNELYKGMQAFTKQYEIKSKNQISVEMWNRGYNATDLEDIQAYTIAQALLCDYYFIGTVTRFGNKTNYSMTLKAVDLNVEIDTKTNSATEETKLIDFLNNDLRACLDQVQE